VIWEVGLGESIHETGRKERLLRMNTLANAIKFKYEEVIEGGGKGLLL